MVIAGILRVLLTSLLLASTLLGHAASAAAAPRPAALVAPNAYNAITWRGIGPYRGGRAVAVAGVPGAPNVFYFGAVAGGVWKTTDAGATWRALFDAEQSPRSAPSRSRPAIRASSMSARAKATCAAMSPRATASSSRRRRQDLDSGRPCRYRQIGALIVDPHDPNIVLVAAIGHAFGPNAERGVFRTADGGKTWKRVLYKMSDTGPSTSPSTRTIRRSSMPRCGRCAVSRGISRAAAPAAACIARRTAASPGRSSAGHGLPDGILGRIDVSVSAADSQRIYAMIEAPKDGGLYRSDDGGTHWSRVSDDGRMRQRAWYFSKIYADPKAVDTVYALNTGMLRIRPTAARPSTSSPPPTAITTGFGSIPTIPTA